MRWTIPLAKRWAVGVLAAAVSAAGAAILVETLYHPGYRAQATVRVTHGGGGVPTSLPADDQADAQSDDATLPSPLQIAAVLARAASSEQWKAAGLDVPQESALVGGPDQMQYAMESAGDELLIWFADSDPAKASAAVRCIAAACEQELAEQHRQQFAPRLKVLEQRRDEASTELERHYTALTVVHREAGDADVQKLHQQSLREQRDIDALLAQTEKELASFQPPAEPAGDAAAAVAVLTPREIAAADPLMRQYLRRQIELQRDIDNMAMRTQENDPALAEARAALGRLRLSIERYAQSVLDHEPLRDGMNPSLLGVLQIARIDPEMRQHLRAKASLLEEQDRLMSRLGERHPMTTDTRKLIAAADLQIQHAAAQFRGDRPQPLRLGDDPNQMAAVARLESLRQRRRDLSESSRQKAQQVQALARQMQQAAALAGQISAGQARLDDINRRLADVRKQSSAAVAPALEVISQTTQSTGMSLAAARGVGAAGGAVLAIIVLSLLPASRSLPARRIEQEQEIGQSSATALVASIAQWQEDQVPTPQPADEPDAAQPRPQWPQHDQSPPAEQDEPALEQEPEEEPGLDSASADGDAQCEPEPVADGELASASLPAPAPVPAAPVEGLLAAAASAPSQPGQRGSDPLAALLAGSGPRRWRRSA